MTVRFVQQVAATLPLNAFRHNLRPNAMRHPSSAVLLTLLLSACAAPNGAAPTPAVVTPMGVAQSPALASVTTTSTAAPISTPTLATLPDATIDVTATPLPTALSTALPYTLAASTFEGIPQGLTHDGFPFLGQPDAPVTLIDYSDFQ